MNKKYIVNLSKSERLELKDLISSRSPKSSVVINAQILLAADEGTQNKKDRAIVELYHVSPKTVQRIREKFVLHGLEIALKGLPRGPQRKRIKIDGDVEAHIVKLACSEEPEGYNKWTLRLLADKAVELEVVNSISHESVRQVLKKMKLNLGETKCG